MFKFILFCITLVVADRPSCVNQGVGYNGTTYNGQAMYTYVSHDVTALTLNLNPASVVLPPAAIAYASLTVQQTLLSKNPDDPVFRYPITNSNNSLPVTGSNCCPVTILNTTVLPIREGVVMSQDVYSQFPVDSPRCHQPFGVVFGDSFINDRVVFILYAPGDNGTGVTAPTTANVTIMVCDNVTVCSTPFFPRSMIVSPDFIANSTIFGSNNTCYYLERFVVPYRRGNSRVTLAAYFEDGDLFLYRANFLNTSVAEDVYNPLYFIRRIAVGANLPNFQLFGAFVRQSTSDWACLQHEVSAYFYYLTKNQLLVEYGSDGLIRQAAFCGSNPTAELFCVAGTFNPTQGLYGLSQYRVQANATVVRTVGGAPCSVPYSLLLDPPQPIVWKRVTFSNCVYNYASLVAALPNYDIFCSGISATKLNELCFGSVTLDVMRISTGHYANLKGNVPTEFTKYNYKLPDTFTGCVHAYWVNASGDQKYAFADRPPAVIVTPGGRQSDSAYINTIIYTANSTWCRFNGCLGLAVISVSTATANDAVCPDTRNSTDIILDQCVNFNVYGYSGVGVIKEVVNYTIPDGKLFVGTASDTVAAFAGDNNKTYYVNPCASASVSVGYVPGFQQSMLFNGIPCNLTGRAVVQPVSLDWSRLVGNVTTSPSALDLSIGCLIGADNFTSVTVPNCTMPLGDSYCLMTPNSTGFRSSSNNLQLVSFNPYINTTIKPITPTDIIGVATNFTLVAQSEYIQTYTSKVTIDCVRYICGDSVQCQTLLNQYGTFCVDINKALSDVNTLLDQSVLSLVDDLTNGVQPLANNSFLAEVSGDYNFTSLVGCIGSSCGTAMYRSALSDLLYSKVTMADPGFMTNYQKCLELAPGFLSKTDVLDLACTQTYNGIAVLPPIVSPGMQAAYTAILTGGIAASAWTFGISSVAVIPFATQIQFRLNGIGVTMNVIQENQKVIANAFNNALTNIQKGFEATNDAIYKIQAAVNQNAAQMRDLVVQLSNNFGAISSSLNIIYSRLDELEANAQVDRLINGRFSVLNTYVTQLLIKASELRAAAKLASQKFSECVKSQSKRYDFCGDGVHVISFPQQAPNGVLFVHYSYKPTEYKQVCTTAGLCVNGTGYVPVEGIFVQNSTSCEGPWFITSRNFYNPVAIQYELLQRVDHCEANYTIVNNTVYEPSAPSVPDYSQLIDTIYKNVTAKINISIDAGIYNFTGVNLSYEINQLYAVIDQLNRSYINLTELGTYTKVIRWPWYVWLGFIAGLVGLCLVVVMLLCMTNCCSCFRGMCNCHLCRYEEYEDVYPAVRTNKRRA